MDAVSAFYFAHPFWVWLAVGAIFLAIEVVTGSGWMLWPAAAAALVGVASLFMHLGAAVGIALFALSTIVLTYVGRRFLRTTAPGSVDINDASGRLIGHRGEASAAFEAGLGRVFVDGKEWSAELADGGAISAGTRVEVTAVLSGARLRVKAV
jgi:membrane protein implicated in regulation of membrane protease activity